MTADDAPPGLWLIGLGPGNLDQMTVLARKSAKSCSKLYLEGYTAVLPENEESRLKTLIGPWERIMREEIEIPKKILQEAKTMAVGILVVGDPMQATTHIDLESYCEEENIEFHLIPGISATSLAVSLSGMQSYRFGRQITLPYSFGDYLPKEVLVLLEKIVMKYKESNDFNALLNTSVKDWRGILLSDLGGTDQQIFAGTLGELSKIETGEIHSFILPAKFTGMEEEAFNRRRLLA